MKDRKNNLIEFLNAAPNEVFGEISQHFTKEETFNLRLVCKRFGLFNAAATKEKRVPGKLTDYNDVENKSSFDISEFITDPYAHDTAFAMNRKRDTYAIMKGDCIYLLDPSTGEVRTTLKDKTAEESSDTFATASLRFTRQEDGLFTSKKLSKERKSDYQFQIWDLANETLKVQFTLKNNQGENVIATDIHPDGYIVGLRTNKNQLELFRYDLLEEDETKKETSENLSTIKLEHLQFFFADNYSKIILTNKESVYIYDLVNKTISPPISKETPYDTVHASKNYLILSKTKFLSDPPSGSDTTITGCRVINLNTLDSREISPHWSDSHILRLYAFNEHNLLGIEFTEINFTLGLPPVEVGTKIEIWGAKSRKKLGEVHLPASANKINNLYFIRNIALEGNKMVIFTTTDIHTFTFRVHHRLTIDTETKIQEANDNDNHNKRCNIM